MKDQERRDPADVLNAYKASTDSDAGATPVADVPLDTVLHAFAAAEPETAFEARLLRRLAEEQAHVSRLTRLGALLIGSPRPVTAAVAAAALCLTAAGIFLHLHPHLAKGGGDTRTNTLAATSAPEKEHVRAQRTGDRDGEHGGLLSRNSAAPFESGIAKPVWQRQPDTQSPTEPPPAHLHAVARVAKPIDSSHQASFPAPEMPLTEQERLLLSIAHRNDPVQVAMLDPAERNLRLARERAESARFFAPPKLPPELQEEINAALRSQYVNTPPPHELLAKSSDQNQK